MVARGWVVGRKKEELGFRVCGVSVWDNAEFWSCLGVDGRTAVHNSAVPLNCVLKTVWLVPGPPWTHLS